MARQTISIGQSMGSPATQSTMHMQGAVFIPEHYDSLRLGGHTHQSDADYRIAQGLIRRDEIARANTIARSLWNSYSPYFDTRRKRLGATEAAVALAKAKEFTRELLHKALGYERLVPTSTLAIGERIYPITYLEGTMPILVGSPLHAVDSGEAQIHIEGSNIRKRSVHTAMRELLNTERSGNWGLVCNGLEIRLLCRTASLTRPMHIAFDLQAMFAEADTQADFAALWYILHGSRSERQGELQQTIWDLWRSEGQAQGTRIREGLRSSVTDALQVLGEGFLSHPHNHNLRESLANGSLSPQDYFRQLLRLVYRFLFLFTTEERDRLHSATATSTQRTLYQRSYSMARLTERSFRRTASGNYSDLWQGVSILFSMLASPEGEPLLGLPALGGLFRPDQCPDIHHAQLHNSALLDCIYMLRWTNTKDGLTRVDYGNLGSEELGSIYESLLELVPHVDPFTSSFSFITYTGNERKTSGSYYSPESLVQQLLKTALEPVIEQKLNAAQNPARALLEIRVIDPACGSGHFLIAAARRIAERVADERARAKGTVAENEYERALHEVVANCIYGVDINPMAIELARFVLWLEGIQRDAPLSFLDHHLVVGDSLLGLMDLSVLAHGIPDAAYSVLAGDEKEVCAMLKKANQRSRDDVLSGRLSQSLLVAEDGIDTRALAILRQSEQIESMPEDSLLDIETKQAASDNSRKRKKEDFVYQAADLYVAAFLVPKIQETIPLVPRSDDIHNLLSEYLAGIPVSLAKLEYVADICENARVFHWPLEFPHIVQSGGFDCVLGNPPWEVMELKEKEFFSSRNSPIASLAGSKRKKAIQDSENDDEILWKDYLKHLRPYQAFAAFARENDRFPLTAKGRLTMC